MIRSVGLNIYIFERTISVQSVIPDEKHMKVIDCWRWCILIYNLVLCDLEKAMATHSSVLAWRIPWTEEPGRLQSMGSLRVGHDWATSLSLFTFINWRRKWQLTPQGMGEPGRLPSMGLHRVRHDWSNLAAAVVWSWTNSLTTLGLIKLILNEEIQGTAQSSILLF